MTNDDRTPDEASDEHPIDPPVREDERYRLDADRKERGSITDAGRTGGGGSLGHVQPGKVEPEAPLQNDADGRESEEPTLPSKESPRI